jgi:hypothetical protein
LSGLLLIRFGGFVAHGFGRGIGFVFAVAECLSATSATSMVQAEKSRSPEENRARGSAD